MLMQMVFDAAKLWLVLANLGASGKITYARGETPGVGKVRNLDADVPTLNNNRGSLDCSGYVPYVIYQATWHNVRMSGGTMSQQEWLDENDYRKYRGSDFATLKDLYSNVAGRIDDTVRIGFRSTNLKLKRQTSGGGSGQKGVGHVWLTINGKTYESTTKSGNNGPASFPFSARTKDVDAYYLLGPAPGFGANGRLGAH